MQTGIRAETVNMCWKRISALTRRCWGLGRGQTLTSKAKVKQHLLAKLQIQFLGWAHGLNILRSQFRDSTETSKKQRSIDFNWIFRPEIFFWILLAVCSGCSTPAWNSNRFPLAFRLTFKCLSWKWMHFTFNYNLLWFPPPQRERRQKHDGTDF